jgi:hypothetical protein
MNICFWCGVRSAFCFRSLQLALIVMSLTAASCGGGSTSQQQPPPPPSPDFGISTNSQSLMLTQGASTTVRVSIAALNGFTGTVSVTISGLPSGVTGSPSSPFNVTPGTPQTVMLTASGSAGLGSFPLSIQGTSGNLQHSVPATLQVLTSQLASFSVTLNNSELSFSQGGSASTIVGLTLNSAGNSNFTVNFSISGLPTGVQAAFGLNPFPFGQPATSLGLSASSNAGLANYSTVTVTATRTADGAVASATFLLNVTPPVGALPAIRTDFIRTDGTPASAAFDAAHGVVYVSNPQWNRVDVISPTTHQIIQSVSAPGPTGMDLSLDGTQLITGSKVQQIVSIDTASLQVVNRTNVTPIVVGGASYAIPALLANTSNGTTLVGMTLNSDPPAYYLEQWNPAAGTFISRSASGVGPLIDQLVRTGDGTKALVVDYGSDVNMAVYDAASDSFSVTGQSSVGQVLDVAGSPVAHQFAVIGTSGLAFIDSNLNILATPPLGGVISGMKYSADGSKLYITAILSFASCGPFYPVILTYNTSSFSLVGAAPSFQVPSGNSCPLPPYRQAVPLATDNTGLEFSAVSYGLVFDDAANYQNLLNLPLGPPFPQGSLIDEAALNMPLATNLGQIAFDTLPDVWFGNLRGTNIAFEGPLVSVTAPPSPTVALVNVKAVLPDGWFSLAAQAFSFGSQILFVGGNTGSPDGGATLTIIGYGLLGKNATPAVTIGGASATVLASAKYADINDSAGYPFPDVDEVQVVVPPGKSGAADVTVTSQAGVATLPGAFAYLPSVTDYPSSDTFNFVLYDSQRHWVYLSAGDHIDVFSADAAQFLTPITPPSVSGARKFLGLALTPDKSKLLAANFADVSVAIIDPDNPSTSKAVQIPVNVANSPGVADVIATSTGKVFVDGVSGTFSGCGGQLWQLDLTTLSVTPGPVLPFPGLQVGGDSFSGSADGSRIFLAGQGCGNFLWVASTNQLTTGPVLVSDSVAASGDGNWFASDYTRLDGQLIPHMQAQIPDFFYTLPGIENTDISGEKMNASGSLLYTPLPNGIDVTDTNRGTWLGRVLLTETVVPVTPSPMDFDETGNRLFLNTNKGLTVVELASPPLSIGYLNPSSGPITGGTSVTIRGSGFQAGTTVTFGGVAAPTSFVDTSTLQVTTPALPADAARVTITNPGGASYSLDAAFQAH